MGTSLKYVSSAATLAQLFVIVLQFQLGLRLEKSRTMTLVLAGSSADRAAATSWDYATPLQLGKLALELLLSALHTPPGVQRDIRIEALGSVNYYRAESVLSVLTCVRLYHIWRWINMRVQFSFCNLEVR
jgi:hypothetical protein